MALESSTGLSNYSFDDKYILVVAIDFGTTFSGYAFSFKTSKNDIKMNNNWGAELGCVSHKAPTCVMTNPDDSFHCFGYKAEHEYSKLEPGKDVIGGPNGYNLYRHFKMMLHGQGVNLTSTVVSTTGHITKAIDIFVMVLKYLHGQIIESIGMALERPPTTSDIRWVLTVPAIWTDESKAFMREAAYRAGLISEKYSRKLLIALEPEAASMFCTELDINTFERDQEGKVEKLKFKSGQKLLIIDAGGGTVDITAHELLLEGKVKEAAPPSGGPWGGIKVDAELVSLLSKTFGVDFINNFKDHHPQQWLQCMTLFEKSKKAFLPDGQCSIKVSLPYSFEKELKKQKNKDMEDFLTDLQDPNVYFNNGFLCIKHERARQMFLEPISKIIQHVRSMMHPNYILLVGGFGECKMLQEACKQEFGHSLKLLIPVEAQIAVIKGAVLFGHNPLQIHSRIARFTYGRIVSESFDASKHDAAKKITSKGKDWCGDCFQLFITKGEEIQTGTVKHFQTSPLYEGQTNMNLNCYRTEKKTVMYVDEPGVTRIGKATFESNSGPLSDNIKIRITFGHTEILVEARDANKETDFSMQTTFTFI